MKLGCNIGRVLFALWVCVGAQLHTAVAHGADAHEHPHPHTAVGHGADGHAHPHPHAAAAHGADGHEHPHPEEGHGAVGTAAVSSHDDEAADRSSHTICCYRVPPHHHHHDGTSHTHMVDAIPTNPAHRELVTPDTVVAILHALELAPRQESTAMEQTQLRLPEPVVCEFARLRAPPLA